VTAVEVRATGDGGTAFAVTLRDDDGSRTTHEVTVSEPDWERFGRGFLTREALVEASFTFLLEREPKESILGSFDLGVIQRYFPEYPEKIGDPR
jgi:hypothetical protein